MEERSCFLCSLEYKLPTRKPYILQCCTKNVCSECLEKIIEKKKCPTCRDTLEQTSLNSFDVNVKIEETLNFEEFGDLKWNQCQENSDDRASKLCMDCGLLCRACHLSHSRMKIFETHKIVPIPREKWSKNLEAVLKLSLNCDVHKNQRRESYCKSCKKAICEECIVESHKECHFMICKVDDEFEETRKKLQENLNRIEVKKITENCLELMEKRKSEFETLEREIEDLKSHCMDVLKRHFDEVKLEFRNKAKIKKDDYEKNEEQLQKMKDIHKNLCDFIDGSSLLQNKVGFLQLASKVMSQTEYLQNGINKVNEEVIDVTKKIDYLGWIKEILSELQLAAGKNASVDFALEVAEECQDYPFVFEILSQYRSPNGAFKCHHIIEENNLIMEVYANNSAKSYRVNYKREMFPRYEYHLKLINELNECAYQIDDSTITHDLSKLPQCTIIVHGREKNVDRNLFQPSTLEDSVGNESDWRDFILVVCIDTTDDEEETFNFLERQMENCIWCIIITSNNDTTKLQESLNSKDIASKFSIISPDPDALWNYLASALELPLIETLRDERNWPACVLEDVQTVLKRIEKCSDLPELGKNKHKSYDIPENIKKVLKRFEGEIIRYGFVFEKFRVVVSNEKFDEVNEAMVSTASADFCEIIVISQDNFKQQEKVELYSGAGKKVISVTKVAAAGR